MKKSKIILAVVLAAVLAITCISVPTFSWFTRPQSLSGEKMVLQNKNAYTAYNGKDVTISTKSSSTGIEDSYTTDCTASADFSVTGAAGTGIGSFNRKYFCTTITNSSGTEQNVSLYVRKLSIPTDDKNGTLALGVNGPTRSYHDYSTLAKANKEATRSGTMRIYFEKDNNVTGWSGTSFYICWARSGVTLDGTGSNGTYYKMTHVGGNNNPNQYYADIPSDATSAFFAVENWGTNDNGSPNYAQRTVLLTSLTGVSETSSMVYKLTNTQSNENQNVQGYSITPPSVARYYSSVSVPNNDSTVDITLQSGWYTGGSVDYYSGDTSLFGVVNGKIIPVAGKTGTAKLYTKVTGGSYPDTLQVETDITITSAGFYEFNDVPIVKNVKIPAEDSSTEAHEGEVKVYWYVINNSSANKLRYTIDDIYLGL